MLINTIDLYLYELQSSELLLTLTKRLCNIYIPPHLQGKVPGFDGRLHSKRLFPAILSRTWRHVLHCWLIGLVGMTASSSVVIILLGRMMGQLRLHVHVLLLMVHVSGCKR
jgi:hypothetical protein